MFGLMPAWRSSLVNIVDALKEGARGSSAGRQHKGMRELLVIGETALAAMLLVAAGLLLNSLYHLVNVDPGFNADRVLRVHLTVPSGLRDRDKERQDIRYRNNMLDSVAAVPGVVAVGGSKTVPLNGGGEPYEFDLAPFKERGSIRPGAGVFIVTPGYFEALQIPLRAGRAFSRQDEIRQDCQLMVNESLQKRVWASASAVDKILYLGTTPCQVIGVAADVHNEGLANQARDTVYVPERISPRSSLNLFIRTKDDPLRLIPSIRQAIWSVDKEQAVSDIATMQQLMSDNIAQPRFFTVLLGVFGALAVLLAAIGAYGVIAYSVRERTQEFGIRIALGADRAEVLRLVIGQAMALAAIGLGVGLIAALLSTRALSSLLFGVKPLDVPTFAAAAIVLMFVALLAAYLPARSATKVDPLVALRYE
jgi:putative ABC transport system permease protein